MQDGGGDGGRTTTLRDTDGSLSGYPGATLLPAFPDSSLGFYSAPGCVSHPAYGLACPQKHVNLELGAWDWRGGSSPKAVTVTRGSRNPGQALAAQRLPSLQGNELSQKAGRGGRYYNAAAAVGGSYLVTWGAGAGKRLRCFRWALLACLQRWGAPLPGCHCCLLDAVPRAKYARWRLFLLSHTKQPLCFTFTPTSAPIQPTLPLPPDAATNGAPARAFAQCSSCAPGDEVEAVLCYPRGTTLGAAGVTRASWEFVDAQQDTAGEAAPGAFASLAAMRAASGQGSRYFFDANSGLLFLRVRQAAGWGSRQPDGYCPPGGCAVLVVHAVPAGVAPTPQQCEAQLAALPGGAPTGDAFLSATLPQPLFNIAVACPRTPLFGCDCWGHTGCGSKECTPAERATCDVSAGRLPVKTPQTTR